MATYTESRQRNVVPYRAFYLVALPELIEKIVNGARTHVFGWVL